MSSHPQLATSRFALQHGVDARAATHSVSALLAARDLRSNIRKFYLGG